MALAASIVNLRGAADRVARIIPELNSAEIAKTPNMTTKITLTCAVMLEMRFRAVAVACEESPRSISLISVLWKIAPVKPILEMSINPSMIQVERRWVSLNHSDRMMWTGLR
jgi:hypothetical protein